MKIKFDGTAEYYSKYRPVCPKEVVNYVKDIFRLDRRGVLLDMGCGTGTATFPFAKHFEKTLAIDAEQEMIEMAKLIAPKDLNIEWRVMSANDLTPDIGACRLAIACRAFHWFDQDKVLKTLYSTLKQGGGIAIIGDRSFWTNQDDWQKATISVVQKYLGRSRPYESVINNAFAESFEVKLEKHGFKKITTHKIPTMREWNFESILGYLYSTSFSAKHLYVNNLQKFENELKTTLNNFNTDDKFIEHNEWTIHTAHR